MGLIIGCAHPVKPFFVRSRACEESVIEGT
jgi:hypothetical protein